jgi:hypothetical protein
MTFADDLEKFNRASHSDALPEMQAAPIEQRLSEIEEAHADTAFLAMSKLRDMLVRREANSAACRVDEAIEKLTLACRNARSAG